jgi:hypothetical protein
VTPLEVVVTRLPLRLTGFHPDLTPSSAQGPSTVTPDGAIAPTSQASIAVSPSRWRRKNATASVRT